MALQPLALRAVEQGRDVGEHALVVAVVLDCDQDALIYRVIPNGPACHTGAMSCFNEVIPLELAGGAPEAARFPARRRTRADDRAAEGLGARGSYTAKLFAGGVDRIGKKIGEEATEVVIVEERRPRRTGVGNDRPA